MPHGRGHKGGTAPQSQKHPSELELVNRVPPNAAMNSPQANASPSMSPPSPSQAVYGMPAMYLSPCTPATYSPLPPHTPSMMTPPSPAAYPSSSFMSSPANYVTPGFFPHTANYTRPYYPYMTTNLFMVCFNISVCIGCKNRYLKTRQPPQDLCIRHQVWRTFTPRGEQDAQERFGNVYYHCNSQCVWFTGLTLFSQHWT